LYSIDILSIKASLELGIRRRSCYSAEQLVKGLKRYIWREQEGFRKYSGVL
jgi:hypothetical protein